jgi:hypothetical protein
VRQRLGLVGLVPENRQAIGGFNGPESHRLVLPFRCCEHPGAADSPARRVKGRCSSGRSFP